MQFLDVISLCEQARVEGKTVVLVTGVFDVLHQEHITFLEKARGLGAVLVVGLEADSRVKELKGEGRPVNMLTQRVVNIERLKIADAVFGLPEKFHELADYRLLLEQLQPDILAVSSHTDFQDVKEKLMAEIAGKVVIAHEHNPSISTTILLNKNLNKE